MRPARALLPWVLRGVLRTAALSSMALPLASGAAEEPPQLRLAEGRLHLVSLPQILDLTEVREPLASGLTTSFVFEVTARDGAGGKSTGGAVVEIRYELWDEVYLVMALGARGVRQRTTLASREQLLDWWRTLDLTVADAGGLAPSAAWQARVRLAVLPFSSAEQRDAQRWFSRSLDSTEPGAGDASVGEASDVLNLLIATSIARDSALSFDWRLAVPASARGPGG